MPYHRPTAMGGLRLPIPRQIIATLDITSWGTSGRAEGTRWQAKGYTPKVALPFYFNSGKLKIPFESAKSNRSHWISFVS